MDTPRLVKGIWQVGPLMPEYRLRPPTARLSYHQGSDLRNGSPVEVILLRPPWNREQAMRRELLYGVERLRPLDHPNIVRILDVIEEDDLVGYVTDHDPGESIHRRMLYSAAIFTEAEVVRIISEIAIALEHAHERGILFANVKPTNVRLATSGAVKLFALPKEPHRFVSFVDTAWYLGHAVYHPAEFLRCEPLDQRTDVYGLGITAYEMMVSRMPRGTSGNLGVDLSALLSGEWPAPADLVEDIDPLLNQVIVRCLKKNRDQRYATVGQARDDLRRVRGKQRALIAAERLLEIVTSTFPTPLATLARSLAREDHLVTQKDKLLNQANGLIDYLGFLAALGLGNRPEGPLARPSLGHWVGQITEALREGKGWPFSEFRSQIADQAAFLDCLNGLVQQRNRVGHGTVPEEGSVLHEWVRETSTLVRRLYKSLLFLARYALVYVEDMDYRDGQFHYTIRRLEGVGEQGAPVPVTLPQPYTKGKVYFASADFSRLLCLDPYVAQARCPLCGQTELFFYASMHGSERRYVTPDRGHTWACHS